MNDKAIKQKRIWLRIMFLLFFVLCVLDVPSALAGRTADFFTSVSNTTVTYWKDWAKNTALPKLFPTLTKASDLNVTDIQNQATEQSGKIEAIIETFAELAHSQRDLFQSMAISLFKITCLIGLALMGCQAILSRASFEDILRQFILFMLFAAFCYTAIIHFDDWVKFLIDAEQTAADSMLSTTKSTLSKHVDSSVLKSIDKGFTTAPLAISIRFLGILLASLIASSHGFIEYVVLGIAYLFFGIGIIMLTALLTARLVVVTCESLIGLNLGVILLGFGGLSYTRDYAIGVLKYAVSTVVKLLAMHFIVSIGVAVLADLADIEKYKNPTLGYFAITAVIALILYVIANSLPNTIAGIISGTNTSSGVGFRQAMGAAMIAPKVMGTAALTTATAGVAGATAFMAGVKTASMQAGGFAGKGLGGGIVHAAKSAWGGVSNMAAMAEEHIADRQRSSKSGIVRSARAMRDMSIGQSAFVRAQQDSYLKANPNMSKQEAHQQALNDFKELSAPYLNIYSQGRGGNPYFEHVQRRADMQGRPQAKAAQDKAKEALSQTVNSNRKKESSDDNKWLD